MVATLGRTWNIAVRLLFAAVVTAIIVASACSRLERETSAPPPSPVSVAMATRTAVPIEMRATGTIGASSICSVKPRVNGLVVAVEFDEGQDVSTGDVLFRLDRKPFEVALSEAIAKLEKSRAQEESAQAEAKRYEGLVAAGVASRQDAETRRAAALAAKAGVSADRAAVEAKRLNLEYATIRAPIAGRTGRILVGPGNVVLENETPLVEIRKISPASVTFSIPESALALALQRVAEKEAFSISVGPSESGGAGPREAGRVTFIDNAIKPEGTVELHGMIENAAKRFWPGQFVNVSMSLGVRPDAVVVPAAAVLMGPQGVYVFVVLPDDTVERRPVATGAILGDGRVVVDSGLSEGERVVTEGHLHLEPGAKVVIALPREGER